jgi:hypothetical protein
VKNELTKQGLDVNVNDWREKARRLREIYQRADTPEPPRGSRERESYILKMDEERNFVSSIRGLICFALQVYGNDLIQTRQDIPTQVIIRKPSPEYLQAFLKMDDVETQLKLIEVAMRGDYCGR